LLFAAAFVRMILASHIANIMRTFIAIFATSAALIGALLLTACNNADVVAGTPTALPGKICTVQFRRDALGAAASLPVPPMSEGTNGATTSITGKLKSATGDWIVVDPGGTDPGRPIEI
jgi:hypothetical protein